MKKHTEEIKPFKIEKGIAPAKRGKKSFYPREYFRIQATMNVMEKEDSFLIPINGFKSSTLTGWATKIEKDWSNLILDIDLREKSKKTFYRSVIKDSEKKEVGVRIFRVS